MSYNILNISLRMGFHLSCLLELLSIRDIQHIIDLVSSKALPNKLTYRMAYKEEENLDKQVQQFFIEVIKA